DEVAEVQARRGRIEAAVEDDRPGGEIRGERVDVGGEREQATPAQVLQEIGHAPILPYRSSGFRAGATGYRIRMIFITAKFKVLPEYADQWPEITREFTAATRGEPGCLWFDWSRSLDDACEYVIVEAFRDGEAGAAHVGSAHFKSAQRTLPAY